MLRSLRANSSTARVPIVVLSSLPQSNESQLKKEGATAYFDKSTLGLHQDSESLTRIVSRILGAEAQDGGAAIQIPGEVAPSTKGRV